MIRTVSARRNGLRCRASRECFRPTRLGWQVRFVECGGFTHTELISLLAICGVVATLVVSAVGNAQIHSRKVRCFSNLRQVALGIEAYSAETGKRPRSLSRVILQEPKLRDAGVFVCPSDPGLQGADLTNRFWGNLANASQEPWAGQSDLRDPESGSWTAELAEVSESEPFSYLHPLSWRRLAWQRLAILGSETGLAVCQLHGVRVPANAANPNFKQYLQYEGAIIRGRLDGSVVQRRVFRPGLGSDGIPGADYPWEFYTDVLQPGPR